MSKKSFPVKCVGFEQEKDVYNMDEKQAALLWSFFCCEDSVARICTSVLKDLVFRGDAIPLLNDSRTPKNWEQNRDQHNDMLYTALSYYWVLGMVPYFVAKAADGTEFMQVPDFGTGTFHYRISQHKTIFFFRSKFQKKKRFWVYVWRDNRPFIGSRTFVSHAQRLFFRWCTISSLRQNAIVADFENANPINFISTRPSAAVIKPDESESVIPSAFSDQPIQPGSTVLMGARSSEFINNMWYISQGLGQQREKERVSRCSAMVSNLGDGSSSTPIIPLPEFSHVQHGSLAHRNPQMQQEEQQYFEHICMALGIPPSFMTTVGSSRFKSDAEQAARLITMTIEGIRANLTSFYSAAWQNIFGASNLMALQALAKEDLPCPPATEKNLGLNIKLMFKPVLIASRESLPMMQFALENDFVTPEEMACLVRDSFAISSELGADLKRKNHEKEDAYPASKRTKKQGQAAVDSTEDKQIEEQKQKEDKKKTDKKADDT